MKKFLLVLVTTIFLAGCANEKPPVDLPTEKVLSVEGTMTITHDGKISLSDERKVFSSTDGNVVATYFKPGQLVTEGQPLFQVGRQEDAAQLLQEKVKLSETMTTLTNELSAWQQAEMLFKQNAASAQDVADKKFAVEERQAEVDKLKQRVQKLEDESSAGIVTAPISGSIDVDYAQLGTKVTAGDKLATIGKNNPLVVSFEVSPEERQLLLASDALKVLLKLSDGTSRDGTLKFPDDSTAEALFDNSDGSLTLGSAARVELGGVKISKALLVPESAIQRHDDENFVLVAAKDKSVAEKKITLGGKLGTYFIVNDGLKADDSIVVEGRSSN